MWVVACNTYVNDGCPQMARVSQQVEPSQCNAPVPVYDPQLASNDYIQLSAMAYGADPEQCVKYMSAGAGFSALKSFAVQSPIPGDSASTVGERAEVTVHKPLLPTLHSNELCDRARSYASITAIANPACSPVVKGASLRNG